MKWNDLSYTKRGMIIGFILATIFLIFIIIQYITSFQAIYGGSGKFGIAWTIIGSFPIIIISILGFGIILGICSLIGFVIGKYNITNKIKK
jgi:hypothetical protein